MTTYLFRNCLLDTVERRVIRDGLCLEMTPRTFDVLQMLVERAGEIVTKDELLGHVWNGRFVEEGNLPVHIRKLRLLLGCSRANRYIETSYGAGYRFVCHSDLIDESGCVVEFQPSDVKFETQNAASMFGRIKIDSHYFTRRIAFAAERESQHYKCVFGTTRLEQPFYSA